MGDSIAEYYEGRAIRKAHIETIKNMLKEGLAKEFILKFGFSEDEFREAQKQFAESEN